MRFLEWQSNGLVARSALNQRTADAALARAGYPAGGADLAHAPPGRLAVSLGALPPHAELRSLWLALQARAEGSFFTSWSWVGPWVESLPPDCRVRLLSAQRDGRLLALGLVVDRPDWRLGLVPIHTTHLHATGRADCDGVTIEYNGLLVDRDAEPELEATVISQLMAAKGAPDEFRLPGCRRLPQGLPASLAVRFHEHPSYHVNLQTINASGTDYLGCLKPRARHAVRKSIKRLSETAPLRVVVANSVPMAQQFMAELQRLHTAHWQAKGEPGAFADPFRRQFHARVLEQGVPEGRVVLLALYQGDQPVAYFYYLCHDGWVHYYQSGVDYARLDGSQSPGLAGHALAIEHFRAAGWRVYDFMAGDLQYKRTMCTDTMPLFWGVVQQRSAKMRIENAAVAAGRLARACWQQWRKPPCKVGNDARATLNAPPPKRSAEPDAQPLTPA